jgi:hypothetical protein
MIAEIVRQIAGFGKHNTGTFGKKNACTFGKKNACTFGNATLVFGRLSENPTYITVDLHGMGTGICPSL